MSGNKVLAPERIKNLLQTLEQRFLQNPNRHPNLHWEDIQVKLIQAPKKLWSLNLMEETGGEPDVISIDSQMDLIRFYDCSPESPKGRRSLCYDDEALISRKEHKPDNSAQGLAREMGIEIVTEDEYFFLQSIGTFDLKTSSWILTPASIRKSGGAIFGDKRYGRTFIYHNGAESYYAARGFRGSLKL